MKTSIAAALCLFASAAFAQELEKVPTNFDPALWLSPPGGALPASTGEPSFRFICNHAKFLADDPIVYPGQPGASHLHEFFGNTLADASSTYASLRLSGHGTCHGGPLNRSAYWISAMLDGMGNAVKVSAVSVYYKSPPSAANTLRELPRGLKFITGFNMAAPDGPQPNRANWGFLINGRFINAQPLPKSITEALTKLTEPLRLSIVDSTRPGWSPFSVEAALVMQLSSPNCWDGQNLDSSDHRSHMAFKVANESNNWINQCPPTHPVEIPQFTLNPFWHLFPGDDLTKWKLSSDMGSQLPGSSMHADWFGAWDDDVKARWTQHCLRENRSSVEGNLCDGQNLKRAPEFKLWHFAGEAKVPITVSPPPPLPPPLPPVDPRHDRGKHKGHFK